MKKITTLYKKDPNDLGRVIDEVNPGNEWVFKCGMPTRKYDGTACAIIGGELYKRFDLKPGRSLTPNSIPCQEPDEITGHHPHWVKCDRDDPENKWHFVAFDSMKLKIDGTYELCGEKINGNPEKIKGHCLIPHGLEHLAIYDYSFEALKAYLTAEDIEGIVFHNHDSSEMCKIRKSDFGIKR